MKYKKLVQVYLALTLVTVSGTASSVPTDTSLPEVTVSANAVKSSKEYDPKTVVPDTTRYGTYLESFGTVPFINVQASGRQQQSLIVNGFSPYRSEQFMDGVRLNTAIMRDGPNQYSATIDPFSVSFSSFKMGQSTLLAAPDSFGAEVTAFSKSYTDFSKESSFTSSASYRYATAENSHIGHAESSGNYGNLGFHLGVTASAYGNLVSAYGVQQGTSYNSQAADLRLDYKVLPNTILTGLAQYYTSPSAPRTHSTILAQTNLGNTPGSLLARDVKNNRFLGYLGFDSKDVPYLDYLNGKVSYQNVSEKEIEKQAQESDIAVLTDSILGVQLHGGKAFDLFKLNLGVDYYRDTVNSAGANINNGKVTQGVQGAVADKSAYDTLGAFVNLDTVLIPNLTSLSLTSRYDYAAASFGVIVDPSSKTGSKLGTPQSWSAFTSGVKISTFLSPEHDYRLSFGVNQHVRFPTLYDLTGNELARSSDVQTPATTLLSPEHGLTCELEGRYIFSDTNAGIRLFRTDLHNVLVRTPTGSVLGGLTEVQAVNRGNGFTQGISFDVMHRFSNAWIKAAFSYTYGVMTEYTTAGVWSKDPASRINPINGNIQLHYDVLPNFYTESLLSVVGTQTRLSERDKADTQRIPVGGSAGYILWDVKLGYKPADFLNLNFMVNNLLDVGYRPLGSGLNGAGRNFVFQFDIKL